MAAPFTVTSGLASGSPLENAVVNGRTRGVTLLRDLGKCSPSGAAVMPASSAVLPTRSFLFTGSATSLRFLRTGPAALFIKLTPNGYLTGTEDGMSSRCRTWGDSRNSRNQHTRKSIGKSLTYLRPHAV